MKKGVVDAKGRGQKVTFDRKFKTNNDWECGPPIVVKADDSHVGIMMKMDRLVMGLLFKFTYLYMIYPSIRM